MRFVSLFAGVGGFDLGFEQAGMECVGQVEIDKHASSVLAKHWPEVPRHDDVQTAKEWADEQGLVGRVDLVCGGFPCQDVSVAGKRAGLAGSRTGLFWDALDFATHVKARWIVLENVAGLFSSNNGHDFAAVIGAIRDAGFHYVEWRLFDSQFYGVPQRRRRVYIVGCVADPNRFPLFVERESCGGDPAEGFEAGQDVAPKTPAGAGESGILGSDLVGTLAARDFKGVGNQYVNENKVVLQHAGWLSGTDAVGTVSSKWAKGSGGPSGDEHYNLVVSESDAVLMRQREGKEGGGKGPLLSVEKSLTIATSNDQVLFPPATTFVKAGRAQSAEDAETWREDSIAPTVNTFDVGDSRATVLGVVNMQGSKGTGTATEADISYTLNRMHGHDVHAVAVSVVAPTLSASNDPSRSPQSSEVTAQIAAMVEATSVVRRLTPTECERLQGFPDDWTAGQADSHRYKQMGNAVTVNVVEWVGRAIMEAENG